MRNKGPKYTHRLLGWEKVSGRSSTVLTRGELTDVIGYEIAASDHPDVFGKTMIFLSDLHWQMFNPNAPQLKKEIIAAINTLNADFVIFGGDLTSFNCNMEDALGLLQSLHAKTAKIAIPGNWDLSKQSWFPVERWKQCFTAVGFSLLINQEILIDGIRFFGVDDVKTGTPCYTPSKENHYSLVLSHNPDSLIAVGRRKNLASIDLVLCGHTHGGQIRLPWFGAIDTSSRYPRKFDRGKFVHKMCGTTMLISAGIGHTAIPFRWNCKPEILHIKLI